MFLLTLLHDYSLHFSTQKCCPSIDRGLPVCVCHGQRVSETVRTACPVQCSAGSAFGRSKLKQRVVHHPSRCPGRECKAHRSHHYSRVVRQHDELNTFE